MKVLNVGSLNIDYVYQVPHFVLPGETLSATTETMSPGGKGLNQSLAMARAGIEVYHAGCIGVGGQFLKDLLQENGVHTNFLKNVDIIQGNAVIQVDPKGENCILLAHGSNFALTLEQIQEIFQDFQAGDVLVLQNEVNNLKEMVELAKEKGMRVFLNPSPYNETIDGLDLRQLDWLILNEVEVKQITKQESSQDALNILQQQYPEMHILLTLGKRGSLCVYQSQRIEVKATPVTAIDTTGAGDTYTGYFIAGLVQGLSIQEAMEMASVASAISVTRLGAAPSIPIIQEVREYK